jgi:hypothetical protein
MTIRGYRVAFDWSRTGQFTGTLEDVTTPGSGILANDDLVVSWGRQDARGTQDATAGQFDLALNNHGRQFSPENTASPIYGDVLPGTRVQFQVTVNDATTTLFDGPMDKFKVDSKSPARTFSTTAYDGWGIPGAEKLSTPVYSGMRTGDLINVILDAIGWDPIRRDIDPGATVVDWWWLEGQDASTAVTDLVHSEGPTAIAYVIGGVFTFRDRHHRLLRSQSTASQGLITYIIPAGSGPAGDFKMDRGSFDYDHGIDDIFNVASFQVQRRAPAAAAQVWNTESPISLNSGEVLQLIVQASDPFIYAQVPQPFVYDADGNPISGEYLLTSGSIASITLSRTSGQTCIMTITAGGSGCFLPNGIALTAAPLTQGDAMQVASSDQSSINTFDTQTWDGETPPWCNQYDMQAIADRIVAAYAGVRPVVTLSITTSVASPTAARYLAWMVARAISDRVTIRNDDVGFNSDMVIERLAHTVTKLGTKHRIDIGMQGTEPVQASNAFTFDGAGQGFDQGAFGVNGIADGSSMFQFDVSGHGFDQGKFAV